MFPVAAVVVAVAVVVVMLLRLLLLLRLPLLLKRIPSSSSYTHHPIYTYLLCTFQKNSGYNGDTNDGASKEKIDDGRISMVIRWYIW